MGQRRILSGIILLFVLVNSCFGQNNSYVERTNGFLGLQVGVPTKATQPAIKNNMGNTGFGAGFMFLTNPFSWGRNKRNSPLRIGAGLGYTYYGRFLTKVNINGYQGDYKTAYGILDLNGVLQFRPQVTSSIQPFVEILAGGNFYISTIRENLGAIESALGIPAFELDAYSSASFNKGAAIGFSFGRKHQDRARFTIRGSYNIGSAIKYIVRNSLQYDQSTGLMEYAVGKAPVRYFLIQAGIGF
jgi:hypothetical protein